MQPRGPRARRGPTHAIFFTQKVTSRHEHFNGRQKRERGVVVRLSADFLYFPSAAAVPERDAETKSTCVYRTLQGKNCTHIYIYEAEKRYHIHVCVCVCGYE